jgi:allantoicase
VIEYVTGVGPDGFTQLPDLAVRGLGGAVVVANDEFFGEKENLIKAEAPVFDPSTFGHRGKVYDGWETRRRRGSGHDWAIVRLGVAGVIRGVVIDTAFFTGNYPPYASVEACGVEGYPSPEGLGDTEWNEIVPRSPLAGDTRSEFPVTEATAGFIARRRFTHVRLNVFPDGGVARLRVHGEVVPDPRRFAGLPLDLVALENGGQVVDCSNMFYSAPAKLLLPDRPRVMADGWETARRREGGHDYVTVRLTAPGHIRQIELDTSYFKGNAPAAFRLSGCLSHTGEWVELIPHTRLQPDTRHFFRIPGGNPTHGHPVAQVRVDIYPDGGFARLRVHGELAAAGRAALGLRWFDTMPVGQAVDALVAECDLAAGAAVALVGARPVGDAAGLEAALSAVGSGAGGLTKEAAERVRALVLGG